MRPKRLAFALSVAAPAILAALALSGCDQPKWRGKSAPPSQAATSATSAAPAPRVIPVDPSGAPAAPEWAKAVLGKALREAYPKTGVCQGNTDIVQKTYSGTPPGVQIHGWGWDKVRKASVARVILVDKDARIVGAGAGGVARKDVPKAVPEITDPNAGWNADAPITKGPLDAYGVVGDGDSVCPLGRVEF